MRTGMFYALFVAMWLMTGIMPATAQTACSTGAGTVQVDLTLPNLTSRPANLFWIDYNCVEQPYGVVAPGAIEYQTTFEGHVWVLRDDSGQVIEQFTASPSRTTILVTDTTYQPTAITSACSSAATTQQLDLTVINNTDKPVLVNLILYNCTEQTLAIVPGLNQHIQQTVIGHDWVIRLSDGNVGKQITMSATDNVVIIDPPPSTTSTSSSGNQGSAVATLAPASQSNTQPSNNVPALTGQIAFTNWDGTQYDIYTMNADGSNVQRLTDQVANDSDPIFSPDGSRIVFISARNGNSEVYIMNADGSNQTRLTNNSVDDFFASFLPDGSRILFRGASDFEGDAEIYTMNVDGSDVRQLTGNNTKDTAPQISPDGTLITFVSDRDGNDEIYIMNVDGSNAQRLTDNPADEGRPKFSPNGSQITFNSERDGDAEVFVMNADGSNVTQLTANSTRDFPATFSADGTWILFTRADANDADRLFVIRADGTDERQLADFIVLRGGADWYQAGGTPTTASQRIIFSLIKDNATHIYSMNPDGSDIVQLTQSGTTNDFPAGSSDGLRIAFESNQARQDPAFTDVFMMNADGTNVQQLVFNEGGSWSPDIAPDGSRILFSGQHLDATNNWVIDIGMVNADGSNLQWITNDSFSESFPRFSPDGRRIVFCTDVDGHLNNYSMNVDGSDLRQLTSDPANNCNARYTPDGSRIVFSSDRGGDYEIYSITVDGSDLRQLTDDTYRGVAANPGPDGRIVYARNNPDDANDLGTVYVMNADGSNPIALTNGRRPIWLISGMPGK